MEAISDTQPNNVDGFCLVRHRDTSCPESTSKTED
jgi:hypothetical protein